MNIDASLAQQLAPTGRLRAALNLGNPVLARSHTTAEQPAGVTIDLTRPEGREAFYRLIANSDVFIENNAPDVVKRFNITYDDLIKHYPALVMASLPAFGASGPYSHFRAYGANRSPMKFSEVFTALQTGVMDGQENPFTQIYSAKFQEVQKYLSLTGHVYTPAYLTAGTTKWNALPADVRKILEDTAKETQAFVYQTAAKDEDDLLAKLKAGGIQVNDPDKNAFVAASKPVYDEFGKEVSGAKALIDRAIALGR